MFKTIIILDEDKIENEEIYPVSHYKELLEEICNSKHLFKEEENLFVLDKSIDSVGICISLMGQFKKTNILYYLKEWIIYSDEEGESEEIIQEDFLDICRKRGLIC